MILHYDSKYNSSVRAICVRFLADRFESANNFTSACVDALMRCHHSVTRKSMTIIALNRANVKFSREVKYTRDSDSYCSARISQIVRALCVQNSDKSYSLASCELINARALALTRYLDLQKAYHARYSIVHAEFCKLHSHFIYADMLTDTELCETRACYDLARDAALAL